MSVNAMAFEDAAAILNNIRKQVTGETAIAPLSEADFISVGNTVLQAGYDPVMGAITQMVSRTIFSIRPYSRKFGGIKMDSQQWGAIVRKLAIADQDWETDQQFNLVDGQSIDHYEILKPSVLQLNFYGANTFAKHVTIFKDQLDNAFSGSAEFGRFMAMVTQNVSDMIEQNHESIARMTLANFVGAKVSQSNGVIHLLTEYNTETGITPALTSTTVYDPQYFGDFCKWLFARVATLTSLMTERTQEFQMHVTGKEITRHTPYADQKVYMYAPLMNELKARVLSGAFHPEFIDYADVEAVNFWQSVQSPMSLSVTPVYMKTDGTYDTAAAQSISNLVGVIFDQEALGYTMINETAAVTPLNASGLYWNQFWHETSRWYNDQSEKGIILLLD